MKMSMETEKQIFDTFKSLSMARIPKPLISICGWCPDAPEKTRSLVAQGYDVSHGMCDPCSVKMFNGQ